VEQKIAKYLLKIGAVFLRPNEPFIWASGIKSPIYCDNRLILTSPEEREEVEKYLAETITKHFPNCEAVMGTATAGIAHAALAAALLRLPMGYVRGGSKEHGRQNQIEGRLERGQKTVVVEDLISTAGSSIEAVKTLRSADADVLGIVSIFTYGMKRGIENLEKANVKSISLTNFDTLIRVAAVEGFIEEADIERLLKFRNNPNDESWILN
jgi:orotate phosphoribosyltransferase